MRRSIKLLIFGLAVGVSGCKTGQIPDINDPTNASIVEPESLQVALRGVYDNLAYRVEKLQITPEELDAELTKQAAEFARGVDIDDVSREDAWRAAEIFRTAKQWPAAARLYERAVAAAQNSDRKVNDTLQLARCYAQLNRVPEAIATARQAFSAPPGDKGAILPAVLLEIVPAAVGKGHDGPLATLLIDAVAQHLQTEVDASTDPGKAYLLARRHHVRNAMDLASRLYRDAGDAARAAATDRRRRQLLAMLPEFELRR